MGVGLGGGFVVSSVCDSWRGQHSLKQLYQPLVSSCKDTTYDSDMLLN